MGSTPQPGARGIAARVLVRVWESDAFAAAALDAELRHAAGLDPRDAALATELTYGVLRTGPALLERIDALVSRKKQSLGPAARAHLMIGAYSLCFLDRVPTFAAVSEAVGGVEAEAGRHAAGFANAILRKLASSVEAGRPALTDAIVGSAPGWLRGGLRRALGRSGAAAYLAAGPVPPPIGLCLAVGEGQGAWIDRLRAAAPAATFEPGTVSPRAILVRGAGDVRRLPGAGVAWIVQEEGSQLVALAAGARAGDTVLDACAGRGNKSWILTQSTGDGGAVDAADLYGSKLEHLREEGRRVRAVHIVDWTAGVGGVPGGYDRALVDAPCSGVGTLRRRPEIAHRRTPEDVPRLAALQLAIVRGAATRVRDGGRLVFSVCSVLREEAEDVVAALQAEDADAPVRLELTAFDDATASGLAGGEPVLRLLPHVHGTDGYFIASFTVRAAR